MNEKVFQDVFDKIQDFLPVGWKKMVFFAGYTEGSYSMKFYSQNDSGEYVDCFNMTSVTKAKLIKLFMDIDKVLSRERAVLDCKNKWSILTMVVEADGTMKTEFDYDNHSEDLLSYEKEWKKKYL